MNLSAETWERLNTARKSAGLTWEQLAAQWAEAGIRISIEPQEEAVYYAEMAAEAGLPKWVKLELTPEPRYLLPDPIETLKATEILVKKGFAVLPYINADPMLALRLQDAGAATVRLERLLHLRGDHFAGDLHFHPALDAVQLADRHLHLHAPGCSGKPQQTLTGGEVPGGIAPEGKPMLADVPPPCKRPPPLSTARSPRRPG